MRRAESKDLRFPAEVRRLFSCAELLLTGRNVLGFVSGSSREQRLCHCSIFSPLVWRFQRAVCQVREALSDALDSWEYGGFYNDPKGLLHRIAVSCSLGASLETRRSKRRTKAWSFTTFGTRTRTAVPSVQYGSLLRGDGRE